MKIAFMIREGIANANNVVWQVGTLEILRDTIERKKVYLHWTKTDEVKGQIPVKLVVGLLNKPEIVDGVLWVEVLCNEDIRSMIDTDEFVLNSRIEAWPGENGVIDITKGIKLLNAFLVPKSEEEILKIRAIREEKERNKIKVDKEDWG